MTTYGFHSVLVWPIGVGGAVKLARNQRINVTDPATGLVPAGLKQDGQPVSWLTSDRDGEVDYTATVGVVVLSSVATGFSETVVSPDLIAEANGAATAAASSAAAAAASAALVGAPSKSAMDAAMGGDVAGLVPLVTGKAAKADLPLNVRSFGAVGDGTTDDTAAINSALTYAAANPGHRLFFPGKGPYKVTATLGPVALNDTTIDLGAATLDFTGLTSGDCLTITGSISSPLSLTANVVEEGKAVAVATSTLAAGDRVLIASTSIFDSTRTSAKYGEMNAIKSIDSSSALTLKTESSATYTTAAAATIRKITPISGVTITGGRIRSTNPANTLRGLDLRYGVDLLVQRVRFEGINRVQLQMTNVAESTVTKCRFERAVHASQGYGCSVQDATCDVSIIDNKFREVRHSVTTNNDIGGVAGGVGFGIVRRILVDDNIIIDSEPATGGTGGDALDTHAGAEQIDFIDNRIYSSSGHGINFEARSGTIRGNRIRSTAQAGIYVRCYSDLPGTIEVANNKVHGTGPGASDYGISIAPAAAPLTSCSVTDNTVTGCNSTALRVVGAGAATIGGTTVEGNTVDTTAGTGMQVTANPGATITGNNAKASVIGITVAASNAAVSGNTVELRGTTGANGWGIRIDGTRSSVTGNTLRYSATGITSTIGVSMASTATYTGAWCNVTEGFGSAVAGTAGTGNVAANNI